MTNPSRYVWCLLLLLAAIGAHAQETVRLPVKVQATVDAPNHKPAIDALATRVASLEKQLTRLTALEKRVAELEARLGQLTAKVTLEFRDPSGQPTPGVVVKQFAGQQQVASYTSDKSGNVAVELKLQ